MQRRTAYGSGVQSSLVYPTVSDYLNTHGQRCRASASAASGAGCDAACNATYDCLCSPTDKYFFQVYRALMHCQHVMHAIELQQFIARLLSRRSHSLALRQ